MMGLIRDRQWTITNDPTHADVIIVNTCGFIESAKTESIDTSCRWPNTRKQIPTGTDRHRLPGTAVCG